MTQEHKETFYRSCLLETDPREFAALMQETAVTCSGQWKKACEQGA